MAEHGIAKGVILAGGTGSRLYPLTKVTNKHLLPVGRYPMIYWPLNSLIQCDIRNIMVISGIEHMDSIVRVLGSGRDFGVNFTYRVQDEAGGIAQALGLCEEWVGADSMMVILGDNVFLGDLADRVAGFERGARILLSPHPAPERFGVAEVEAERVIRVVEKPEIPPSNLVVTGCYLYDSRVFEIVRGLRPSGRGELEITDVNNAYIEMGEMTFAVLDSPWTDAGTPESLAEANRLTFGVELDL
jgi:glucose-1-phosphate thymidylyltransferase